MEPKSIACSVVVFVLFVSASIADTTTTPPSRRDYVAPPRQNVPTPNQNDFIQPSNPTVSSTTPSPVPSNRRDYVAPIRPSVPVATPRTAQAQIPIQSTPLPGRRDYVAPSRPGSPKTDVNDLIRLSYGEQGPSTQRPQTGTRPPVPPRPSTTPSTRPRGSPPPVPPKPTTQSSVISQQVTPSRPTLAPFSNTPKTTGPQSPGSQSPSGGTPPISPQSNPQRPPTYAEIAARGATGSGGPNAPGPDSSSTEKPPRVEIASDDELKAFSEAVLRRDVNNAAKYVSINIQGKTKGGELTEDPAPQPLLTIDPEAYNIPTIQKMRLLFNNYIQNVSANEHVTPQEKMEENDLIDAIIATPIMVYTRKFLMDKGLLSPDPKDFRDQLKHIWFNMYSRGFGKIGSSGFEHVFLSEIKKGEITGLHNWVYFGDEEKENRADYLGYVRKIDLGDKGAILKFRFKLNNIDKPVNSLFIGTSPELEMSLYTVCYFVRPDRACPMRLNDKKLVVRAYKVRYRGNEMIGSAYPEI